MSEGAQGTPQGSNDLLRVAEAVHAGEVSVAFEPGPVGVGLPDGHVRLRSGSNHRGCGEPLAGALRRAPDARAARRGRRLSDGMRLAPPGAGDRRPAATARGAGGVTTAEELRHVLPDAHLTLIGEEPYDFYNRMAITRLVSESASIDSLYLNRRDWAESRRIEYRRGVAATVIDRANRQVETDDGRRIPYDRLVIATGARPYVPPIEGFGVAGSFVVRTIDDAVQIQQYARRWRGRTAVVVGGGLLGLETAYNVAQLDLRVLVLDRGPWPLSRQLDEQAGALLWEMLEDLGIEVVPRTEAQRLLADGRFTGVG